MSYTLVIMVVTFFAFCFIAVILLLSAADAQARLSDRMGDRDWAARHTKKHPPRGGSV
jgi:hypothetical protein